MESSIKKIIFFLDKESKEIYAEIFKACSFFNEELNKFIEKSNSGEDVRSFILVCYIIVPSLALTLFREIMLCFFQKKGISIKALRSGDWLSQNLQIKSKLLKEILLTQDSCFNMIVNEERYFDAIDFFTKEKGEDSIHRNKVAHDICSSLEAVSKIDITNIKKNADKVFEFLEKLSEITEKFDEKNEVNIE